MTLTGSGKACRRAGQFFVFFCHDGLGTGDGNLACIHEADRVDGLINNIVMGVSLLAAGVELSYGGEWSVERGAWSVERGAWSVERGAWSVVDVDHGMGR